MDPYTPPADYPANPAHQGVPVIVHPATRWQRLVAAILDSLLLGAIATVTNWPLTHFDWSSTPDSLGLSSSHAIAVDEWLATGLDVLLYLLINGYFLIRSGQSLGKKALGIQIVSHRDYRLLPAGKLLGIREALPYALATLPIIGPWFALLDPLWIFSADKRCLHDHLAGSVVIQSTPFTQQYHASQS